MSELTEAAQDRLHDLRYYDGVWREVRPLPVAALPVVTFHQSIVDITGLQDESRQRPRKMRLLITVIDGKVTEVAPRAEGDRGWGIPLPTEAVS